MSKKDEKILELQYSVEALENEIESLEEDARINHEKLWTIIQENDRLTMTYEPYRPPGDEHEGLDFYELIDENKDLKKEVERLVWKGREYYDEAQHYKQAVTDMKMAQEKRKRYSKAGVISFDFWPPRDWFRLSYHPWKQGMAAQLCIGPIRIDWFAS